LTNLHLITAGNPDRRKSRRTLWKKNAAHDRTLTVQQRHHGFGPGIAGQTIGLLQKSHVLAVTSVKEGWGLVVTEANPQGTPAVVYNVDGLRTQCDTMKPELRARQTLLNVWRRIFYKIIQ